MLLHVSKVMWNVTKAKLSEAKLKLLNIINNIVKAPFATSAHEYEIYD